MSNRNLKSRLWHRWCWFKNPKCVNCQGDGLVHFDGENIWLECEHCNGLGYINTGGTPFDNRPLSQT